MKKTWRMLFIALLLLVLPFSVINIEASSLSVTSEDILAKSKFFSINRYYSSRDDIPKDIAYGQRVGNTYYSGRLKRGLIVNIITDSGIQYKVNFSGYLQGYPVGDVYSN